MTVLDDVLDALSARFNAAAGVPVYDGPDRDALTAGRDRFVFIGTDGEALVIPDADDSDGMTVTEERSEMGPGTWRTVTGEITCAVWAWQGDNDMRARRREAEQIAAACSATVTSDRTLGGLLQGGGLADVSERRYRLRHTSKGAVARVVFVVTFTALQT
jgi:hypothetical protein